MVCWHSKSFPLLLLIMLTNHKGLSQLSKCNYSSTWDTTINIKIALTKELKSLAPFHTDTMEECLSKCCSDLPITGGYPCNFMTFAPRKTAPSPNCYLFYCSNKDGCPMINLNGHISYVIQNDQAKVEELDVSVKKLHSQSGEESPESGISTNIKSFVPGLSSSQRNAIQSRTTTVLPLATIHARTREPMAVTTFPAPTVLLIRSSTQTASSNLPVTPTQLSVTMTTPVTTKKSAATTTLLNSFSLTSVRTVPTTIFPIMQTSTRTAVLPTTLPMTSKLPRTSPQTTVLTTTTQAMITITTKPLTTTTLPTTLQTTSAQPTMTTTLPTTLQTTTTQPTMTTTLQTTTTQPTMTTTLQTTTTQPTMTSTIPTTLQTTSAQPTMTTTLPTTLHTTTTQPTMTTTLLTTLQTTSAQTTMTTTLPTTLQTTTQTVTSTYLANLETSTPTRPTTTTLQTTTLPTSLQTTTTQISPFPNTQPMTTIILPTTDLTTTTITTVSTRKLISNVTQPSTASSIPVAKTPIFTIIPVISNNGDIKKKDDGEQDQRQNMGDQNESAEKTGDSQMEVKGGLIAALLFGLLFLTIVIVLSSKQIIESFNRRHYTKMDFLMNGMYVGA